ncbi:MAG: permease [Gemmobacter sp.]
MTDLPASAAPPFHRRAADLVSRHRVWGVVVLILLGLGLIDPAQGAESLRFTLAALWSVAPFLALSVAIAAGAGASGADNLIARSFTGAPAVMILAAALMGAISPFCSCGVIPLIAALLAMGVPLAPVMAFWLASPVMDPSMFVLTWGVLGLEFAVGKLMAAIFLGLLGGTVVHLMVRAGALTDALRDGIGNGGCGGSKVRAPKPVVWRFWAEPARLAKFGADARKTALFLGQWLTLAFVLESLMVAYVPASSITWALGGEGVLPILTATLVGVPAYLNGYAALPLVGGLIGQGMAPGAGMAFVVAGGVTSIPAAIAVWALVRPPVFALYIALSLTGAFVAGLVFQMLA